MILKFVDREEELKALKSLKTTAIIYGRRRIGKTAIALNIAKDRSYIYYLAGESGNLDKFSLRVFGDYQD